MIVVYLIFGVIVLGLLFAAFEELLKHRTEMTRIKYDAKSKESAALESEVEKLRVEVQALKERLDEQAILIDDVQRLSPLMQQRLNG